MECQNVEKKVNNVNLEHVLNYREKNKIGRKIIILNLHGSNIHFFRLWFSESLSSWQESFNHWWLKRVLEPEYNFCYMIFIFTYRNLGSEAVLQWFTQIFKNNGDNTAAWHKYAVSEQIFLSLDFSDGDFILLK